jgi:hypothetical protein
MTLTVNRDYFVGFEVLTEVGTKMAVFWVVAPCSRVEIYQTTRRYNPEDSHLQELFPETAITN